MKRINTRLFNVISERLTTDGAIQELIDNSIDAGAKNIAIELDNKKGTFMSSDDGKGFHMAALEKFASTFDSHIETSDSDTIGRFGVGAKEAIIKLSDQHMGTDAVISTCSEPGKVLKCRLTIDERKEDDFSKPEITEEVDKNWNHTGTKVAIRHIKDVSATGDAKWRSNLKKEIVKAYPYLLESLGINITINGEKIESVDRMYLSTLGDDINEDGIYQKNGLFFYVKTYSLKNKLLARDVRNLKVIYLYISKNRKETNNDKKFEYGGLYTILNGRYLSTPSPNNPCLPFTIGHRGGSGRERALIMVENCEDILGLKSYKSDGIDISNGNSTLLNYTVNGYSEEKSFIDAFENDFRKLSKLSAYEEKYEVTLDIAKEIFYGRKPKVKKISSEIEPRIEEEVVLSIEDLMDDIDKIEPIVSDSGNGVNYSAPSIINVSTDEETGNTVYNFTEYAPSGLNMEVVKKLADLLVMRSNKKLTKAMIEEICNNFSVSISNN